MPGLLLSKERRVRKEPYIERNRITGHTIYYRLHSNALLRSFAFKEEFETTCPQKLSSWMCEMEFPEVENVGEATIPVTLKRTDIYSNTLNICIQMRLDVSSWACSDFDSPAINPFLFDATPVKREGIRGGDVIEDVLIVANLPPIPDWFHGCICEHDHELIINLYITITSCHSNA